MTLFQICETLFNEAFKSKHLNTRKLIFYFMLNIFTLEVRDTEKIVFEFSDKQNNDSASHSNPYHRQTLW